MPTTITYEFDPAGTLLANKITGEAKTPSPSAFNNQMLVVPDAAPFFALGLQVRRADTLDLLGEGLDYILTHRFDTASINTLKPIYGSISFIENRYTGPVFLNYQTLGGPWTLATTQLVEDIYNKLVNPREEYWENVVSLPMYFPHIEHGHNAEDTTQYVDLVAAVDNIALAVEASNAENSEYATLQEAIDGVRTDRIMSPATTGIVIGNAVNNALAGSVLGLYLIDYLRTRLLIKKLVGDALFITTPTNLGMRLLHNGTNWVIKAGDAFIDGVSVNIGTDVVLTDPAGLPRDLWLVALHPDGVTSQRNVPTIVFVWNTVGAALVYDSSGRPFSSFKLSSVTSTSYYTDLRVLKRNEFGLVFDGRNPDLEVKASNSVLVKNEDIFIEGSSDPLVPLEVFLPNVTSIDKPIFDGDKVIVSRSGHVLIKSFNGANDKIRLEKPNGTYTIGESMLFNVNAQLSFRWKASTNQWEV